ncbi:MAG TPA: RluA family pseudouridine synthase [Vicinamibacterales bacterium]|jgi:23S rRNA pseudouridine1911/1915/1917 synthase|nr:RluA family pseudouridine synthase [Vicinamibacterales bacterium]
MTSTPEGASGKPFGSSRDERVRGRTWTVEAAEAGQRLDKFLAAADRAGSRSRATDALARGRVFVDEAEMAPADGARAVAAGEVVRLWMDRPGSAARGAAPRARHGLDTVFEDDTLIVVNKPAGMLTVPLDDAEPVTARNAEGASVLDLLQQRYRSHGGREPFVVHRIDRDTSGVVLFALTARARGALVKQFAERTPERVYLALVDGHPHPSMGTWHDRLSWDEAACRQRAARPDDRDAVDALSDYRVVEAFASTSLLEVRLTTGRQGQIRVQAQLRGHPLVGDRRYGGRGPASRDPIAFDRQALHALQLAFAHPIDRRRIEVTAPPPADLSKLLAQLRHRR